MAIPRSLQKQITYLELFLQLKLNPWKVCCFEFVTRQLLETEALTDFDAEACYVDMRMAHSYGLLEGGGEREAGLPDFFDPAVAERLSAWRLAQQTLAGLERLRSPTQLALALVLVYKYTEQAVGKLLLNAQYRKFVRRHRGLAGDAARPALLPRPEPAPSHVQDLGMDFEARALGDEPAPEEAPESEPEPSAPPVPAPADFDERPYTPEPGLPPFEPAPVAFGMDEVMPAIVYLVLRVRPRRLARLCALAETFCLPLILSNGPAVDFAIKTIQNSANYIGLGMTKVMPVRFKKQQPRFRISKIAGKFQDPLGVN